MYHVRPRFLKLAVAAGMLLWASIAVTPASAAEVTFNFEAKVLTGSLSLFGALSPTNVQTLKGFVTYDNTLLGPGNPTPNGTHTSAITAVQVTFDGVGGYNSGILAPPSGSGANEITISDGIVVSGDDNYQMITPIGNGPASGSFTPFEFELNFIHAPGLFGNNHVPSLGGMIVDSPSFRLAFLGGGTQQLSGAVTNIVVTPLPPAVILFAAGLVALIGLGARNWQREARARQA